MQLAVQHASLRDPNNQTLFINTVSSEFTRLWGIHYRTIKRKIRDLERHWRGVFALRGSQTGTENDTDMTQVMAEWIAIIDDERQVRTERAAATARSAEEVSEVINHRRNLVLRQRDRVPIEIYEHDIQSNDEDITDDEVIIEAEHNHPTAPQLSQSTP